MNRSGLNMLIESVATTILEHSPGAVVQARLLRDVIEKPPEDSLWAEALPGLEKSCWVRQLAAEQWVDGSWGAFHSQNTHHKQAILTTEMGVERALALGLPRSHPVLQNAKAYLMNILQGRIPFPDLPEKNNRWATGVRLFTAATLARIEPEHSELECDRRLWGEIARQTFHSGRYDSEAEVRAHAELTGASIKDSYLVLRGKYQLTILGSIPGRLSSEVEKALLAWLWQRTDGIGYLTVSLSQPPPARPGPLDRWLASHELLGRSFPMWAQFAPSVIDWLLTQQKPDGYWDFGPRPNALVYLPLSDTWRDRKYRKMDWTIRVLTLLKLYVKRMDNEVPGSMPDIME